VIRPLRNINASDPLTNRRPRADRSIRPAPPSRTAEYSESEIVLGIIDKTRCAMLTLNFSAVAMQFKRIVSLASSL
jgi:hypothetical protein